MQLDDLMTLGSDYGLIAEHDGEPCWHPAMVVLIAGLAAFDPSSDEMNRQRGAAALDALLTAARDRGFTQSDILQTLMAKHDYGQRTVTLAKTAMGSVSGEELCAALREAGFNPYLGVGN
jgi:hypothetical protein